MGELRLYEWQKACLKIWEEHRFHGIIDVITGAGKTIFAVAAALFAEKKIKSKLRVRIIVPTQALADQWVRVINEWTGQRFSGEAATRNRRVGMWSGIRKDPPELPFMVYVVNSARYSVSRHVLKDMAEGCSVLFVADECHRYTGSENRKIFDFMKAPDFSPAQYLSLGMSATAQCPGLREVLVPALGEVIYHYSHVQGIRNKAICPFVIAQVSLPFSAEERREYDCLDEAVSASGKKLLGCYPFMKDLQEKEAFFRELTRLCREEEGEGPATIYRSRCLMRRKLVEAAESRICCAMDLVGEFSEGERILLFGERIAQAEDLYFRLKERFPGRAGIYHSRMEPQARKRMLRMFRDGMIRILVCCRALDEGLDVPDARVAIILSGTASERQRIQRLGRVLRRSSAEKYALLYYFYIRDTIDEELFLEPEKNRNTQVRMEYDAETHTLETEGYEDAARRVLLKMSEKAESLSQCEEIKACLIRGRIRLDYFLSDTDMLERMKRAEDQREKNYWICMREIKGILFDTEKSKGDRV